MLKILRLSSACLTSYGNLISVYKTILSESICNLKYNQYYSPLCYLNRLIGGFSQSAAYNAGNAMLSVLMPDKQASVVALMNIGQGLGYIAGKIVH